MLIKAETAAELKKRVTTTVIYLVRIVRTEYGKRASDDQRVRITWTLCEYRTANNEEYRMAFESKGDPKLPDSGTIREVSSQRKQW